MKVKMSQAIKMIVAYMRAKLVPVLLGSPGSGKSQAIYSIAKDHRLLVIDFRLSQADPTDLNGFPNIVGNKAGYLPMNTFPIVGDELPDHPDGGKYNGWLLFFDEITSCAQALQAASYKIILDRKIGIYDLHKNVVIVAAGNLESDNAIVQPMSTALQSRLAHIELAVDHQEWLDWAATSGLIDHRISDFIKYKPDLLYTFKPDHTDKTYACPRTWEFASRVLKVTEDEEPDARDKLRLPMLTGIITNGVAREFLIFVKIYKDLIKPAQIIADPEGCKVPVEPGMLWALTGSLSNAATVENMTPLMKYINRMPAEFQVVTLRETIRRNPATFKHAAVRAWTAACAKDLIT